MVKGLASRLVAGAAVVGLLAGCAAPGSEAGEEYVPKSEFSQELHDMLPAKIQESGKLIISDEPNGPWRVIGADDSVTGAEPDLLKELSKILGVDFQLEIVSSLPAVKLGVQSGRSDIAFGPLLSNEKSQKDLIMIDFVYGRPAFVFPADKPGMNGVEDVCGTTIALIDGSAAMDILVEQLNEKCKAADKPAPNILKQADAESTLVAIESGRADYAATGAHRAAYFESQSPDRFKKYITTDQDATADHLAMGFDRSNEKLAEALFGAWQEVFENGAYKHVMATYNMSEIEMEAPELHK